MTLACATFVRTVVGIIDTPSYICTMTQLDASVCLDDVVSSSSIMTSASGLGQCGSLIRGR